MAPSRLAALIALAVIADGYSSFRHGSAAVNGTATTASLEGPWFDSVADTLERNGFAYIEHLPDGFEHLELAQRFGKLTPQYDGKTVWSIKPDPKFDKLYHSMNTKALLPHTEYNEVEGTPPRYLALWCVMCNDGATTLADGYRFLDSLTEDEMSHIKNKTMTFVASAGIRASGLGRSARHAMLDTKTSDRKILRFSYNNMQREGDKRMDDIALRLLTFFNETQVEIKWSKNAFLIWDNFRMLHSRIAFEDRTRELKRVFLSDCA